MSALWWVRRDMRIHDNPALVDASDHGPVAAVFPWSDAVDAWSGRRRAHLARVLLDLRASTDGTLAVRLASAPEAVVSAAHDSGARTVWAQREFSPAGVREQDQVGEALAAEGRDLVLVGSPYAVAPGRVVKSDGTEYQVFTPFRRAWRDHGWRAPAPVPDPRAFQHLESDANLTDLAERGDREDPLTEPHPCTEREARDQLEAFVARTAERYHQDRDRPDLEATSGLSVALAHGQIHPRTILAATASLAGDGARTFESELAWREFHADVLHHHPRALRSSLTPVVGDDAWLTGDDEDAAIAAWVEGKTGYPLVDAGMRELAATGTMHNRVRMVVASFLVKDLHVRWQRGAQVFRERLLDYDHAQNALNWQWVAGTGRDAAPYFRIFNPETQRQKFDPDGVYVRQWVPEWGGAEYPDPVVDHGRERARSLADYQDFRARRAR